jgi:FkbM family methyltransferase
MRILSLIPDGLPKKYIYSFYLAILFQYFNINVKIYCKSNYYIFEFDNGVCLKSYYPLDCELVSSECPHCYLKKYNLKKGDIVVDAGAFTGVFTLYAAKCIGEQGTVIAFEPDTKNYQQLLDNIKLNRLKNILPICKGLYNKNGTCEFSNIGSPLSSISLPNSELSLQENATTKISVVKLDDELAKLGIFHVDFIKMDIEGAEVEAIEGCTNILRNDYVNLAIASYHIVNGVPTSRAVEQILGQLGYCTETPLSEHTTSYSWKNL